MKSIRVVTMFLGLLISCNQQVETPKAINVDNLKTWFSQEPKLSEAANIRQSMVGEEVEWGKAEEIQPGLVEVPLRLKSNANVGMTILEDDNQLRQAKQSDAKGLSRSLLLYEKKDGFIATEVLLIATSNYLITHPEGLARASYNRIPKDFEGMKIFYAYGKSTLKGGVMYKNGKPEKIIPLRNLGAANGRMLGTNCVSYSVPYYVCVAGNCYYKGTDYYTFCYSTGGSSYYEDSIIKSDGPEVGEGGGGGSNDGWSEYPNPDSQNKLCGSYTFVNTAEGLTAEIITLSASAMHRPSGQHIFHLWGSGCVTFGSSTGLTDSENASRVFNSAWGETMDEAEAWLNARQEKPLEAEYSNYLKVRLTMNLGKHANGYVAFSTGPCSGSGIVSTAARYCN